MIWCGSCFLASAEVSFVFESHTYNMFVCPELGTGIHNSCFNFQCKHSRVDHL